MVTMAGEVADPEKKTVLLVDDEPDILRVLQDVIEAYLPDVKVLTAETGTDGLRHLEATRVDLVVSDYKMPEMDGIEFLRQVADKWPDTLRMILTAFPTPGLPRTAREEAGVIGIVTKPIRRDEVVRLLEEAFRSRSAAPSP